VQIAFEHAAIKISNMKSAILRVLFVLIFCTLTKFAAAGDFVSMVIQPSDTPLMITVPADRFLAVRNFTQQGPTASVTMRGYVSVTSPFTATVLTTTIVDQTNMSALEPINDVVIAGPATVMVNPGDSTCFITYRKGTD
jgi:hypothetical protein